MSEFLTLTGGEGGRSATRSLAGPLCPQRPHSTRLIDVPSMFGQMQLLPQEKPVVPHPPHPPPTPRVSHVLLFLSFFKSSCLSFCNGVGWVIYIYWLHVLYQICLLRFFPSVEFAFGFSLQCLFKSKEF